MMPKPRRTYQQEAECLAKAIDIHLEINEKFYAEAFADPVLRAEMLKTYQKWKARILNPGPAYRSLASLAYEIEELVGGYQEKVHPSVEYFWKRVEEEGLGYTRKNRMQTILNRGSIKGRQEYEYVTDILVVAQQEGNITADEAARLSEMIGVYESKFLNKK